MSATLVVVAIPVAVVAAIRGIWSPCGLSMLSSITPMTEAGRGYRFGSTARWFTLGGLLGGLSKSVLTGAAALGVAALDLSDQTVLGVAAVIVVLTASIDLGVTGIELPIFKRQVDDAWLRQYRSWVYGSGFGWQIGFGVATYIMTAGVFATIALEVLSGSPVGAVIIGATFGLVRGLAVWLGRSGTSPAALAHIHARLDAWAPASRAAAAWVQVLAAAVCASLAWNPVAGLVIVALAAVATLAGRLGTRAVAGS